MNASGVEIHGLDEIVVDLKKLGLEMQDGRKLLQQFFAYMAQTMGNAWNAVKVTGGTYRGVEWPGMKPMIPGTTVMPWGGVPKLRGRGLIKGRLRKGRKTVRVKIDDVMMRDTGNMSIKSFLKKPAQIDKTVMVMAPSLGSEKYAPAQDEMRPFAFFVSEDADALLKIAAADADDKLRRTIGSRK